MIIILVIDTVCWKFSSFKMNAHCDRSRRWTFIHKILKTLCRASYYLHNFKALKYILVNQAQNVFLSWLLTVSYLKYLITISKQIVSNSVLTLQKLQVIQNSAFRRIHHLPIRCRVTVILEVSQMRSVRDFTGKPIHSQSHSD